MELALALLIMFLGLVSVVILPILPGAALIWLGALLYASMTEFVVVGWGTLAILGVIALIAMTSDIWVGALGQRRGGASIWATIFSMIGGIIGLFILNIPGMLIGSIIGALLPEWQRWRDGKFVLDVSWRTIKNWLVSIAIQVSLGLVMVTIFLVRVITG
ncbi:DUF456 domain-containing protein [Herpetosiphon llansteffanensis]|uniref:DUF456 domain-containing protein n=1 Tax=Herpetosiphon llansteffanensis TaxID=2094568 RepID=UPI000D7CD758|nr:DUF456 domain-containing protein [Herpetosiphon llansteffanensis]